MLTRRNLLGTGAALATSPSLIRPAAAQAKMISFLSWNLPIYEEKFKGWIADLKAVKPDVDVEWLDKKGTEWAAFYQTQVAAGTAPDVINVQGILWAEYAAEDGLVDLTPYLAKDPEVKARFNQDAMKFWQFNGKQYMLPYYFSKTLMIYNKKLFKEADIAGPPKSFDEIIEHAYKIAKSGDGRSGFITLNFDWLYWALFAMNGVDFFSKDMKSVTFNTPKAAETLQKLAKATTDGAINNISWTGRWVEPNNAMAAGNIGMYQGHGAALFWIMGKADWANNDTIGVVEWPGGWGVPNGHGFGLSKSSKNPDAAWELIKVATSDKWQKTMAETFTILTLNKTVDADTVASLKDPLKAETLRLSLANMDKATGDWATPLDAKIKDAFWPEVQAALLGQKDAKEALDQAERKINRLLKRA